MQKNCKPHSQKNTTTKTHTKRKLLPCTRGPCVRLVCSLLLLGPPSPLCVFFFFFFVHPRKCKIKTHQKQVFDLEGTLEGAVATHVRETYSLTYTPVLWQRFPPPLHHCILNKEHYLWLSLFVLAPYSAVVDLGVESMGTVTLGRRGPRGDGARILAGVNSTTTVLVPPWPGQGET